MTFSFFPSILALHEGDANLLNHGACHQSGFCNDESHLNRLIGGVADNHQRHDADPIG